MISNVVGESFELLVMSHYHNISPLEDAWT